VIILTTSFLLATLIYGSYPSLDVFVQGKPVWGTHIDCKEANFFYETCCWWEDFGTYIAYACQTCYDSDGYGSTGYEDCKPLVKQRTISGSDVRAPLGEGVLEQLPTPTSPFSPPLSGGVLQQPTTTTPTTPLPSPPPLFGRNVPLQGGVFGQQPTAIVPPTPVPPVLTPEPPVPMFGSTQQATPTPPQFGQIAPETQVLPPLADDSAFPEDGVLEQPSAQESEEQGAEEGGQVIARDDDSEDDDDGPVPPECPLTGPIPPDCTMKPKFPDERAVE
jgi:hypothetical protein